MSKNYEWYVKTDTSKYAGRWIAIVNQQIAVSGYDAKRVYEKAKKKYPQSELSLAKVPPKGILVLTILIRKNDKI